MPPFGLRSRNFATGESGRDGLLTDAEMSRPPDEALEEELLGTCLEQAALLHLPVQGEAELALGAGGCVGAGRHR